MTTSATETFSQRLRNLREAKGLSRAEVAEQIGTTGPIYGRYERGERTPAVDTARDIARALGVSLDYLVGDAPAPLRDKTMMYRLELLDNVEGVHKERILYTLDVLLKDAQNASMDTRLG